MPLCSDKRIMLIGGTGSLGHALVEFYGSTNKLYVVSRDELKQWQMKIKYSSASQNIEYHLGDIRDKGRMKTLFRTIRPHIVILCAALKHIDACEANVHDCIRTNITGVQNVVDASISSDHVMEAFMFISTDKCAEPTTLYGACKMIAEKIVLDKSLAALSATKYVVARYGNVLNSRGSLIPKYMDIAEKSTNPAFPITDTRMTRFFMSLHQSIHLIDFTLHVGQSGETWVPRVPAFKISDIAAWFAQKYNGSVANIDMRPGEKLHETLISESEMTRTRVVWSEKGIVYYVIRRIQDPANDVPLTIPNNAGNEVTSFTSQDTMPALGIDALLSTFS